MQDRIFKELFYMCRLEQRRTTAYASVCSTWKTFFEAKHFERLVLTVSRVSQFGDIVIRNRRQLVKHIWYDFLPLALSYGLCNKTLSKMSYPTGGSRTRFSHRDCPTGILMERKGVLTRCRLDVQFDPPTDFAGPANVQSYDEDKTFAYAIRTLFISLSTWEESIGASPGRLILEISTCRRSFSKISTYHRVILDERRDRPIPQHLVFPKPLSQLPQVNAVTTLQFRRNDFFLPSPDMFRQLIGSFSALKKIEYEERVYGSWFPSHARRELGE